MKRFGWLVLLIALVGCTSYKVSMTSSEMQYSVEYSSFHPDASLMSSLGTAINTLASGLSKQMLEQQSKPPELPVTPTPITPVPVEPGPAEPTVPTPVPTDAINVSTLHGSGFIWKPVSENESKLAILTPASWPVSEAKIGSELLRYSGLTNPDRPTYRGSKPGSGYPENTILEIAGRKILIPDPSKRYD